MPTSTEVKTRPEDGKCWHGNAGYCVECTAEDDALREKPATRTDGPDCTYCKGKGWLNAMDADQIETESSERAKLLAVARAAKRALTWHWHKKSCPYRRGKCECGLTNLESALAALPSGLLEGEG